MGRILITGCGRAGTQYITRLLQNLRLRATHEQIYRHDLTPGSFTVEGMDARWLEKETVIEASWLAAPFAIRQPNDVIVWHQMRDPLKVVRCWASHVHLLNQKWLDQERQPSMMGRYIHQFLPECAQGSDLERAVWYVLHWNLLAEQSAHGSYRSYRVEDLNPEMLGYMLFDAFGFMFTPERLQQAFIEVMPGTGGCLPGSHIELTWEQIEQVEGGKELRELARAYGYKPEMEG